MTTSADSRSRHARDLVDQVIDRARFLRQMPTLTNDAIDAAAANYFVDL